MRSEIVFRAQGNLSNRYQLCRIAARMTRQFHSLSAYTNDAITDAFVHVAGSAGDGPLAFSQLNHPSSGAPEELPIADRLPC